MLNYYARVLAHMASCLSIASDKEWYERAIERASDWLWETK